MNGNPSVQRIETGLGDAKWPSMPEGCDPQIAQVVNTLLTMIHVNDALVRVSRTISDRRRRAKETGSGQTWWPILNRKLLCEHFTPCLDAVIDFQPAGGYAVDAVMHLLHQTFAFLTQAQPKLGLPRYKTDMQLVDEYLQPVFEALREVVAPNEWQQSLDDPNGGVALIHSLGQRTLREWFAHDGGEEFERLLQYLVLGEYYTADYVDGHAPNLFERAILNPVRGIDHIRWDKSGIDAILLVVARIRQRIQAKRARKSGSQTSLNVYFCELCGELTQRASNERSHSTAGAGSKRYCERHASGDRNLYRSDALKKHQFEWLYKTILLEAHRDPAYKKRFLAAAGPDGPGLLEHIGSCLFCSGHPSEPACFDPTKKYFASLMAFHANARKVAYRLAGSYHNGRAYLIDEAVQRGESAKDAAAGYQLNTSKAIGQHRGLALAKLLHQGIKDSGIAVRLGISPSAVSQRKVDLGGSFDFTPGRWIELVWWPFDDVIGPNIAKFPTRSLAWNWRHFADEYRHLARARNLAFVR